MIRIRRLPPRGLRRRIYEIGFTPTGETVPTWTRVTSAPVTLIDPHLGVGDAWSLVHAADNVWDGESGAFSLPPRSAS
jgi:hypothetical protein